jgi:hypothetical protein
MKKTYRLLRKFAKPLEKLKTSVEFRKYSLKTK